MRGEKGKMTIHRRLYLEYINIDVSPFELFMSPCTTIFSNKGMSFDMWKWSLQIFLCQKGEKNDQRRKQKMTFGNSYVLFYINVE